MVIEAKTNELTLNKSHNKLYRGENEETTGKISAIIAEKMLMLDTVNKRGKVNLKDVAEVQSVSLAYLESCRRSDTLPSFEGLCVSMGYSRQWLYQFINTRKTDDPVVAYLNQLRTMFADIMQQASLKRYADCATTIFAMKNMTGLGYSDRGDLPPELPSAEYDENQGSAAHWRQKYGNLSEIDE